VAGLLLYLAALTLPAPALALLAVRFKLFPLVRKTYFFWSAVSLLNFGFLAFLPFPPLLLLPHRVPGDFVAFLFPPALVGTVVVVVLAIVVRVAMRGKPLSPLATGAAPYLLNAAFLVTFIGAADAYKNHLIKTALEGRAPSCLYVSSFMSSLRNAGEDFQFHAHALVVENGRNYYWSYSKMAFFEGNDRLDRNFVCTKP
jgi:hypothetical protein